MITAKASHRGDASSYFYKFQGSTQTVFKTLFKKKVMYLKKAIIISTVESSFAKINK